MEPIETNTVTPETQTLQPNNPAPGQVGPQPTPPPPQTPQNSGGLIGRSRFSRKAIAAFVLLFALVGGTALYFAFAASNNGVQFYWATFRYDETYWDGQVHTSKKACLANHFVCHDNGKLIITGRNSRVWQSDPAKNNPKSLKSPTWYGPYVYSPGPYYGYGFGITGQQQACFYLKDITPAHKSAEVVFQVQNEASNGNPAKVVTTLDGVLSTKYRSAFRPVCVSYTNYQDAWLQQYRVYVRSGTIQIDYVNSMYRYYIYDYNPYPYNSVSGLLKSRASSAPKISPVVCNTNLTKSAQGCLSKNDLTAASAKLNLSNLQVNPSVTYGQ